VIAILYTPRMEAAAAAYQRDGFVVCRGLIEPTQLEASRGRCRHSQAHLYFSLVILHKNKQGGMKITLPPMATRGTAHLTATAAAPGAAGRVLSMGPVESFRRRCSTLCMANHLITIKRRLNGSTAHG
jgi:hypothetical protein